MSSAILTSILLLLFQTPGTATVSGRLLDDAGQPAKGAVVRVFRTTPNLDYQGGSVTTVDDNGTYRFSGVSPGTYYLGVGGQPTLAELGGSAVAQSTATEFPLQYYPGVRELNQATLVEVKAGSDTVIDMKVQRVKTYALRGFIIDAATGKPPASANISLISPSPSGHGGGGSYPFRSYDAGTGKFELRNVQPGSHVLQAQAQILDAAARAAGEAAWAVFPTARVDVVVNDKDLDDLALTLKRPASILGRVRVEGQPPAGQLSIHLTPLPNSTTRMPPRADVKPDGTFEVIGVLNGEYRVEVSTPRGLEVRSLQFAGTDVLNQPLRFSESVPGALDIVLRLKPNAGELGIR
jgi:hypothetical protein